MNRPVRYFRMLLGMMLLPCFMLLSQERANVPDDATFGPGTPPVSMLKAPSAPATGQWSSGAALPIPKKYHAVASQGDFMYVFGGVTTGNYYNAKSYKYSFMNNAWTAIADLPAPKFLIGITAVVSGKIYIMGGLENFGTSYKAIQDLYAYDPATNSYAEMTPMPFPQGQAACGVIDNKIYVTAGTGATNTAFIKTVQVYDPATDSWDTATDYPVALKFLSAATVGNKIVATCGFNNVNPQMYYIADTYVGEILGGTLSWNKVKDYPIGPTIMPTCAAIGNDVLFTGGRPSADNNAPATQRSFKYNVLANAWTTLELKPTGMQSLIQGGTDGSRMFVPGGEDAGGTTLGTLEILDGAQSGGPILYLSTTSFDTWVKKSKPVNIQIPVKNNGAADLTWTASVASGAEAWLSLAKTSGSLLPLVADKIGVTINAGSLTPGDHSGAITLTSNDPGHANAAVQFVIHVQDQDVDTDINVLIEEGTGTWCGYCPYGADSLKAVLARNPGRAYGISYHGGAAIPTNEPMWTSTTDTWATQIGLTGWPNGSVSRMLFAGEAKIALDRGKWGTRIEQMLDSLRSPVSITIKSASWNVTDSRVDLDIEVFFHRGFNKQVRLNVAQVQDQRNFSQVFYPSGGGSTKLSPYFHDHVMRHMFPNDFGNPVTAGSNVASQTSARKTFTIWAPDTLRDLTRFVIFAHVSDGTRFGEVLQVVEFAAKDMVTAIDDRPAVESFSLSQNYPNPFNPSTTISFAVPRESHVSIMLTDIYGRNVALIADEAYEAGAHNIVFNADGMASGTYLCTMRAGSFVQTRTMTLVK